MQWKQLFKNYELDSHSQCYGILLCHSHSVEVISLICIQWFSFLYPKFSFNLNSGPLIFQKFVNTFFLLHRCERKAREFFFFLTAKVQWIALSLQVLNSFTITQHYQQRCLHSQRFRSHQHLPTRTFNGLFTLPHKNQGKAGEWVLLSLLIYTRLLELVFHL